MLMKSRLPMEFPRMESGEVGRHDPLLHARGEGGRDTSNPTTEPTIARRPLSLLRYNTYRRFLNRASALFMID